MAKMTAEEKKEKMDAKKAAAKAKKAAKRAALLEKKRKQAEAKKAAREAKKAKRLARLEKEKAKKAALKEKKRLAKEKQAALKTAKTLDKPTDAIDIKEASKTIKLAMTQIASQMVELDDGKRAKKAKSIRWMGYDVETKDGNVIVRFVIEKSKKVKTTTEVATEEKSKKECKPHEKNVIENTDEQKPEVNKVVVDAMETTPTYPDDEEKHENIEVPAGDIYGQNGNPTGEVANVESDDEDLINDEDEEDEDEDDFIADGRDEQDEDLVDSRREFFSQFGDDFEPNDD